MKFSHLQTYVEVIRWGSFSGAAKALGVSQPAVSHQIMALEKELGTILLLRAPRTTLSLTPAGEAFQHYAESTLAAHEAMRQEIARLQDSVEGPLNLAASAIPGTYLLPALLMALRERYPSIDAQLTVANTRDVADKLVRRKCEIGFIGAPIELEGHVLEAWVEDEIVLAVYPGHPFATRSAIDLKELDDQALIVREDGSGTRQTVERLLSERGWPLTRSKVALVLGSTHGVAHAIRTGLGIGFVSTLTASAAHLSIVRIRGLDLTRKLYISYDPARVETGLHQAFLAFARAWVRKAGPH